MNLPVPICDEDGTWRLDIHKFQLRAIAGVDLRLALHFAEQCAPRINDLEAWLADHGCSYHEYEIDTGLIARCRIVFPNEAVALLFRLTWYRGCEPA